MKFTARFGLTVFYASLLSSPLFATNGGSLIGASSAAVSMGGTGVAHYFNATESLFRNPSLLSASELKDGKFGVEFNAGFLKLNHTSNYTVGANSGTKESAAGSKILPQIAVAYRLDPNLVLGMGIISHAGTVADYTGEALVSQQKTELTNVRILPTIAYQTDKLRMGVSPIIGYGQFMLNESVSTGDSTQSGRTPHSATAFGIQAGLTFEPMPNLIAGLTYLSKTRFSYAEVTDMDAFGPTGRNGLDAVVVEQPQELAVGVSYQVVENVTLTADYRYIDWAGAEGTKQLSWAPQNVIAIGAQYRQNALSLRVGFNYAGSPIGNNTSENSTVSQPNDFQGHNVFTHSISSLNVISFAAATTTHITAGAGYAVTEDFDLDLGLMLVPQATVSRGGNIIGAQATPIPYSFSTTASQWMAGIGATVRL